MIRPSTSHRECLRPEDQETDMRPHWGHTSSTRMLTQAHVPNLPSSDGAGSTSLSLEGCCRHWSHCDLRVRSGHQRRASAQDRASPSVRIGLAIGTCGSPALSLNMDGQQSNRSHSRSSTDGTSSALSHNPRILSHVSVSTKESLCTKEPQDYASLDRQSHPATIMLCSSKSSQASLVSKEHQLFMEEAYNSAICFKMLQDIATSDPLQLKYITKKLKKMAQRTPNLVMETIHDYFKDNAEISSRHRFRLFQVLQAVIGALDVLEEIWQRNFMQLALEHMTKSTELDDIYQDAASNVLLALCRHSWPAVAKHLETELLTGVFPHRSLLFVMGVLSSQEELLKKEDRESWKELLSQMARKSVPFLNTDVWSKELLWSLTKSSRTQQEHTPEKAFLFTYYGLILQAEEDSSNIRTHLKTLLETSHQWPKQREGIALTVGLVAVRHLDDAWAILEQFGRSTPIKWSLQNLSLKSLEDLRWKWAGSTILLSYGQMAAKAKSHILPWVDNILSRMIFYFRFSSWDETLKQSFLTAIMMLVGAISRSEGAHSYEFSQTSELLECLTTLMEKEPQDTLLTSIRQQAIHIVASLSALRPPMDVDKKSRLLSVCFRSIFALPLLDALEKHSCLFLEPPNIQGLYSQTMEAVDHMLQCFMMQNPTVNELYFLLSHLYVWLASEKAHERQRAVHRCMILFKFLHCKRCLETKENFRRMGQLVAMLGILCQDSDRTIQCLSLEAMGHLYQLLMQQKEVPEMERETRQELALPDAPGAAFWSSGDQRGALLIPQDMASKNDSIFFMSSNQATKEIMSHLAMTELTDLIWTAIDGLGSTSSSWVQAAADLLSLAIQEHGDNLATVGKMGQAIHHHLCAIQMPQAKESALHVITLLARNHIPELVAAFLDFSTPLDSHSFRLWRALGAEEPASHLVLTVLMAWMQKRPLPSSASDSSACPVEKPHLRSLAAMNTIHELQFAREFKKAVRDTFPQLFLALLAQMHYIMELNQPTEPEQEQKAQESAMPSPQSTSLEALKSLLSTTGHWHDFAHLELQSAWEHFTSIHTYPQAVGLLARAMVQNHCKEIKAIVSYLLPSLQSQQERERKTAILVLIEFLYSPALLEVLSKQAALTVLAQSLQDTCSEIRVASLQGLGNILFHTEKGTLLRGQLPAFLNGFFQNNEAVVVGIMGLVSDILHRLGTEGAGAQSLSIAINARYFFDDERDNIRAAAMALFGDLVATMTDRELTGLRSQVCQSMVPLLLYLKDQCPAVVTQAKFAFYRCAVLLRWQPRHTLFCTLAWETGLSARHFLWTCLMTHSEKEFSIHLSQAINYLHSHHRHIKTWAALFIGYTTCYQPQAVTQMVNDMDTKLLFSTFKDLKKDPEPAIREFATRQLEFLREVSARSKK
ncbi:maestro heat-like repeat family member 5 isoform X2 [Peromyscus maniculatus bairdii]|uniref:maestro heat-like repeat family member 5 isoform X2 n=2 Tax=Peromyscus maniculatus bairdii TaxID=230844 RepID=UPI003FD028F9